MRLTARQVKHFADALDGITKVTRETGVRFDAYTALAVQVGDATIEVRWDDQEGYGEYVVDDRNGS